MKIRTKIHTGIIFAILASCFAGYYLAFSMNSLAESIVSLDRMNAVVRGLFQFNSLTNEYSRYHVKRAGKQWKIQYDHNLKLLSEVSFTQKSFSAILDSIKADLQRSFILFEKLEKVHAKIHGEHSGDYDVLLLYDEQVTGQIFGLNNSMIDGADKLFKIIYEEVEKNSRKTAFLIFSLIGTVLFIVFIFSLIFFRSVIRPIVLLQEGLFRFGEGDLDHRLPLLSNDEIGALAGSFNGMAEKMQSSNAERDDILWLQFSLNKLDEIVKGEKDVETICNDVLSFFASVIHMTAGIMYINYGDDVFRFATGYALHPDKSETTEYPYSRGLIGQAAYDKKIVRNTEVIDRNFVLSSGLGERIPAELITIPLVHNDKSVGVLELAFAVEKNFLEMSFIEQANGTISSALNDSLNRKNILASYENERKLTKQLQSQQQELTTTNNKLQEKTQILQASEEELRVVNEELAQQAEELKASDEELRATNEELQVKSDSLSEINDDVVIKNLQLENARKFLEGKTAELESINKYKSEFLATMSHELRTPLNSILILAQDLAGNNKKNLSEDQLESADIIYKSGNDLLQLINDILDLSKVEAGKIHLNFEDLSVDSFIQKIENTFKSQAERKKLSFIVRKADNLPTTFRTDHSRLDQVIKNLVSNALKFTEKGSVSVDVHLAEIAQDDGTSAECLAFSVTDTGIGVPLESQALIFEAFQQVDSGISRKYGGTGLGLSISRELVKILGGKIQVESEQGKGSVFTVFLPLSSPAIDENEPPQSVDNLEVSEKPVVETHEYSSPSVSIDDDRDSILEDDLVILIVEDDPVFARVLSTFSHKKGYKCIHAADGETGVEFVKKYHPDAVILDICLPGMQGYSVLELIKENVDTRDIPVHIISALDVNANILNKRVVGYLQKPVNMTQLEGAFQKISLIIGGEASKILIIEDDLDQSKSIQKLIGRGDILTDVASTGKDAIGKIRQEQYDCIILDLLLPDMTGFELLKKLQGESVQLPPIVVYTGREISPDEEELLNEFTSSIIIKGVKSPDRLLDETALFLHRITKSLSREKQEIIEKVRSNGDVLDGRKILLVDDDMRNVFALSKILSDKGLKVLKAANGKKALEIIDREENIDLVLMDIMMPVMDGYSAIEAIRKLDGPVCNVPIIALTAKAMKEDRIKCLDIGANDYMAKPIDIGRLMTLVRIWLTRKQN